MQEQWYGQGKVAGWGGGIRHHGSCRQRRRGDRSRYPAMCYAPLHCSILSHLEEASAGGRQEEES